VDVVQHRCERLEGRASELGIAGEGEERSREADVVEQAAEEGVLRLDTRALADGSDDVAAVRSDRMGVRVAYAADWAIERTFAARTGSLSRSRTTRSKSTSVFWDISTRSRATAGSIGGR